MTAYQRKIVGRDPKTGFNNCVVVMNGIELFHCDSEQAGDVIAAAIRPGDTYVEDGMIAPISYEKYMDGRLYVALFDLSPDHFERIEAMINAIRDGNTAVVRKQ